MTSLLDLGLRVTIWFLLTANFSPANLLIGITVALLIPRKPMDRAVLQDSLPVIKDIIIAIPQAYWEAFEMIRYPHTQEKIEQAPVKPHRSPGLVFLDIFLITFTPKTLVLDYQQKGWYEVHRVVRPGE